MDTLLLTDVKDKNILVRLDLDLPLEDGEFDTTRLELGLPTLIYLYTHKAKHVKVIAHRGRPKGKKNQKLSLNPIAEIVYTKLLENKYFKDITRKELEKWLEIGDNLRFDKQETKGSKTFAKKLAKGFDLYVFDAFAVSHREHTSVVEIPKILKTCVGLRFYKEIQALKKLLRRPKKPFVAILGGGKPETKMPIIDAITDKVTVIMVGGKLAVEMDYETHTNRKLIIGRLTEDKLDINQDAIDQFIRFIVQAKTILWNGPLGKIEDENAQEGTKKIADAIARTRGYKVVGGGDTEAALTMFDINPDSFSFVSSGGGAMLHYFAYKTLPFLEALKDN